MKEIAAALQAGNAAAAGQAMREQLERARRALATRMDTESLAMNGG
jgi:DNA-binding FadR family transcriptional regulator